MKNNRHYITIFSFTLSFAFFLSPIWNKNVDVYSVMLLTNIDGWMCVSFFSCCVVFFFFLQRKQCLPFLTHIIIHAYIRTHTFIDMIVFIYITYGICQYYALVIWMYQYTQYWHLCKWWWWNETFVVFYETNVIRQMFFHVVDVFDIVHIFRCPWIKYCLMNSIRIICYSTVTMHKKADIFKRLTPYDYDIH